MSWEGVDELDKAFGDEADAANELLVAYAKSRFEVASQPAATRCYR